MPATKSLPTDDRLALSVLLAAGADPGRLARWYADNSDHPQRHIATTIAGLSGTPVLIRVQRPRTVPGGGNHELRRGDAPHTLSTATAQRGS